LRVLSSVPIGAGGVRLRGDVLGDSEDGIQRGVLVAAEGLERGRRVDVGGDPGAVVVGPGGLPVQVGGVRAQLAVGQLEVDPLADEFGARPGDERDSGIGACLVLMTAKWNTCAMSDEWDGVSQGAYWDSVTAYRSPQDRISTALRWNSTELDLHGHYLPEIPRQVWTMTQLTELHLYLNELTKLPEELGQLTGLTWLSISDNKLRTLPDGIGLLRRLTRLDAQNNQLTALPDAMANLTELTTLYLADNKLRTLPAWLADLPALTTLHVARNPLEDVPPQVTARFGIQ
jgi:Leucine rich repeat